MPSAAVRASIASPLESLTELSIHTLLPRNWSQHKLNERADVGIERVGVVGAGLMGSGIAEVCARAGADVIVCETDVKTAVGRPGAHRDVARTRRTGEEDRRGGARRRARRVRFTTDIGDLATVTL